MKAAVFHKPKDIRCEQVPDASIRQPTDALIRVTSTAICGSDLHIYNGLFPQIRNMVLGHEFMGVVEDVGAEVRNLKKGDRVVVPFPIACGHCFFCDHDVFAGCENSNLKHYGARGQLLKEKGGGLFGYTDLYGGYDGGQAEAVRVPFADFGPRKVPEGLTDEQVLFLTDIFPTGWTGVDWAQPEGGETYAIFGCGPVGQMAIKSAWLRGAERVIAVDVQEYRLDTARRLGRAETINASQRDAVDAILEMTHGRGADIAIDCVGMEADRTILEKASAVAHLQRGTMKVIEDCFTSVRRGGFVSILGAYGTSYDNFPVGQWFDKGLGVRAGQAPVQKYIDDLIQIVAQGKVQLDDVITHRVSLDQIPEAYSMFNKKQDGCLKVVLHP